ncbi:helix-turn-helix domain-containing protein [Arthrobacter sp. H-02-3]|uniref:helix-turn-helix domain-containing protein n=1 Tax=Arthrobacter sp. H-02-3 TaxID=2703675 RepID=UPI003FA49395
MAKRTVDTDAPAVPAAGGELPRMLTLDQVKEVLNVNTPLVYALVRSGELRAAQFGGRGYLARPGG